MSTTVLNNLKAVLNHFTLQELNDYAVHEFPETTWSKIQKYIVRKSEAFTKKNVIHQLLTIVTKYELENEEIERRTSILQLLAVGKTTKKTWFAIRLKDNNENATSLSDLQDNVSKSVRRHGLIGDINTTKLDNKQIISFTKKIIRKGRGGVQKQTPIFFIFYPGHPYIFSSRQSCANQVLLAIIEGLGYDRFELCKLSGPNTLDLLKLLQNKESIASSAQSLLPPPDLAPTFSSNQVGIDFTQHAKRVKYGEQLYGEKPPQLNAVSVSVKNAMWHPIEGLEGMNGQSLQGVKLTLQAPNVADFIKEMIAQGVVDTPVPPYMQAVLNSAKNQFKISQNNSQVTRNGNNS